MDPIYFQDSLGNVLTPTWSSKDSVLLCSVLAPPSSVAPKFMRYDNSVPHLLAATAPKAVLQELDFTTDAVWYRSDQHWLGWIPTGEPRSSPYETDPTLDLLEICFHRGPVSTVDNFYDAYDSDNQISPVERPAGCHLDSGWTQEATYLGDRLHAICSSLAETSEFYCRGGPLNRTGDVPGPVDGSALEVLFSNEEEAQEAASKAKRGLLSLVGFLSWMLSLVQLKDTKLSAGDQQYLLQLRLEDRPKTGAIFNLTRDQHEINFPHWANNGRFLRFSPEYYEEVARLRERSKGEDVSVEDLPSYSHWKNDLDGSDWIGQNLRAGKMGSAEHRFLPSMKYGIVDRHLYGSRPLVNWFTIRVYAERFKALIREGERETVCTFFRNNPIHKDEPAYARQPLAHRFALTDFAFEEAGESVPEQLRHYESNTVVREQILELLDGPPSRMMKTLGSRKSSRALPGATIATRATRVEKTGAETFEPKRDDTPFDEPLDSVNTWTPKYRNVKEAVDALAAWVPSVLEYDPKKPAYDPLSWNTDWLDKAFLVIDDTRTIARLKTLCALFPSELDNIQLVLEYALRFGMPFELHVKMQDAGDFRNHQLSTLAMNTLPAVDAAQFGIYMGTIYQLLQKPNAIAFIAKGGICKFVAELFAPEPRVSFRRTSRLMIDGQSTLCITDQVTDVEIAILLGHVKGKNSDQERSLWPSQALLEQYSLHMRGYLSAGAYTLLEYLRNRILVEKIYDWKTKAEWKAYLRGGAKGIYAPTVVPSKSDFEVGWRILDDSFPKDWQHASVSKLVLPERFDPHSSRN
ncbi:hypothetical protein B0H14DRAFT_3445904 [Mycena olivaceomarginata]|nr:hypothetical protein B0H14DRAFT_3445904 [Mycena olivaceomarginata]